MVYTFFCPCYLLNDVLGWNLIPSPGCQDLLQYMDWERLETTYKAEVAPTLRNSSARTPKAMSDLLKSQYHA